MTGVRPFRYSGGVGVASGVLTGGTAVAPPGGTGCAVAVSVAVAVAVAIVIGVDVSAGDGVLDGASPDPTTLHADSTITQPAAIAPCAARAARSRTPRSNPMCHSS